ncbi:hypothetical protein [Absidia glauca]|uniref:Pet127-domain-containing protein n=1 Tax=Absidia glauca TaxID=4829 RepID=A0A168M482_ABSGL|nr:hypothetical protein [Absidia glauca]
MWTIRANLVKLAAIQRSPVNVLGYCRGFKTIIGDPVSTSDNKETEADKTTAPSLNAPTNNSDFDKPPQDLTEAISDSKDGQAASSTPHLQTEAASTEDTSPSKKPYSKRRQARRLSQILKNKVIQHTRKPTLIEPSLSDETIQDLDDTWRPLDPHSKYQRIYPNTIIPVATLAHGLEQTLFRPGVHPIKDFETKKRRFSQYLENITNPDDFDYEAMQPYRTSSKDEKLIEMARDQGARFVGSTSSLSGILSHIYFNLSNHRPVDTSVLSKTFIKESKNHTRGSRVPKSILLRWKDGMYAVDADKAFDTGETVLSQLGKSMEKFLTLEQGDYERYLKENSGVVTEEERNAPEAFAYGKMGNLFLRLLQLQTGKVRIGHMDGVMVTYHNTDEIFGFQYISRNEMDARLFGTSKMGDAAFQYSLLMMDTIFEKATTQHPGQTLRMTFDASRATMKDMRIFVEPVSPEEEERMDASYDDDTIDFDHRAALGGDRATLYRLSTNSYLNGKKILGPVAVNSFSDKWDICYQLNEDVSIPKADLRQTIERVRDTQATIFLPQSDESPPFLLKFKEKRGAQKTPETNDE